MSNQFELSPFEKLSTERKYLVSIGECPDWYSTQGLAMFNKKYSYNGESVRGAFNRVASHLAKHVPHMPEARDKFFEIMWNGFLAPSTPVLCNVGTNRGHPVSCSGGYVDDSIDGFYSGYREAALLSQRGYGTSSYLGDIRPRGSKISTGGISDGVVPVFDSFLDVANKVSQGSNRRGQWAGYLPVEHPDFWEMSGYVQKNPSKSNIGWVISDNFILRLKRNDLEAVKIFNEICYIRSRFGKGYIIKIDAMNRHASEVIKACGIPVLQSNLCTEINLPSDEEYTFSCVLSSLNLFTYPNWKPDTVYYATVFLDCVASEAIEQMSISKGFEKVLKFTQDFRALGLGALGWHSLLQSKNLIFDSLEAQYLNHEIFKRINLESLKASQDLAKQLGEPKFCKGFGVRNATRMAIAPNVSSALLCGGVSQGIEPIVANTYNQPTSAGEMTRMNPILVKVLKEKGVFTNELMYDININHQGSVQTLDCLSEHEKKVYRTAFEIPQSAIVRFAGQRQQYIDQGQAINLFFDVDETYIGTVIKEALLNPNITTLYYQRSLRGVRSSKGECTACEG